MPLNIERELAALERLTIRQLQAKYAELFGDQTRVTSKVWLVKRLAWRLQALAEGDLSERARRRAVELANDADLRWLPPRNQRQTTCAENPQPAPTADADVDRAQQPAPSSTDERLPPPGTILTRAYKGQTVTVEVLPGGFAYQSRFYRSLSAVAQAITGTHCNGFLFFRNALQLCNRGQTR